MKWLAEIDLLDLDCDSCDKPIPARTEFYGTEYGHVACSLVCAALVDERLAAIRANRRAA